MEVVIQVVLNVPEGSGLELPVHEYEELLANEIDQLINRGKLSGVSHATVTFEDVV